MGFCEIQYTQNSGFPAWVQSTGQKPWAHSQNTTLVGAASLPTFASSASHRDSAS